MERSEETAIGLRALAIRDVLDYLAPGGALIFTVFLFESWLRERLPLYSIHTPLATAVSKIYSDLAAEHWLASALVISIGLAACYILGHVVASTSALLIERAFIYKAYGYPFHQLLGVQPPDKDDLHLSHCFYRSLFFWVNLSILILFARISLSLLTTLPAIFEAAFFVISRFCYIMALALLTLKLLSTARKAIEAGGRAGWLMEIYRGQRFQGLRRAFIKAVAIPYNVCTFTLSRILRTRKGFDEKFVVRCRQYFEQWFKETPEEAGTNTFWFCYCFVLERSPGFASMLANWRMQYAFARNLAATFYLSFSWILLSMLFQREALSHLDRYSLLVACAIPLSYAVLGSLMLIRYSYIFWSYFSKFVFRAFVYLNDTSGEAPTVIVTANAA